MKNLPVEHHHSASFLSKLNPNRPQAPITNCVFINNENIFYLIVKIVEEDNEAKWTTCHGLSWDEGVLEGGLSLGLHYSVQRQSCELHKTKTNKKISKKLS